MENSSWTVVRERWTINRGHFMTDAEFDVLDELYFVQPFSAIQQALSMEEQPLKTVLAGLLQRGWIRCFTSANGELPADESDFDRHYRQYYYLATKAGLLAHNSR